MDLPPLDKALAEQGKVTKGVQKELAKAEEAWRNIENIVLRIEY